ncbi:MAG: ABC transporter permease [Cyclobacteriaceae bacterium]|nr:ABC transporter permease [Cyclobacteriaceae bacterium]
MKETSTPPQLPLRFFRWYCHPKLRDSIEGDLMELYEERLAKSGKLKANASFIKDVLLLFRPGIVRSFEGYENLNTYSMLKNYFVVGLRHVTKHKLFSMLNIFCLAIGITVSLLMGAYVLNESSVNSTLKNADAQYLVKSKWKSENMGMEIATFSPLAKTLKEEYPHLVENYYRFDPVTAIVSVEDKHFRVGIAIGDTTFISMYGFRILHGSQNGAFVNNQSAVVTESFAEQFFGKKDVVDELITVQTRDGRSLEFIISAVLADLPYNNSITNFTGRYQVFLPMDNNQYFQYGDKGDRWNNIYMVNMVELKEGITPADVAEPLEQVLAKYQPTHTRENLKVELDGIKGYYLKKNSGAVQKMIITLLFIAAFILLMTIINFINIHIGTSSYRLKEIGLRKVFGGAKLQLIVQHLVESSCSRASALFYRLCCTRC